MRTCTDEPMPCFLPFSASLRYTSVGSDGYSLSILPSVGTTMPSAGVPTARADMAANGVPVDARGVRPGRDCSAVSYVSFVRSALLVARGRHTVTLALPTNLLCKLGGSDSSNSVRPQHTKKERWSRKRLKRRHTKKANDSHARDCKEGFLTSRQARKQSKVGFW